MNPNVRTAFVMGGGLAVAAALAVLAGLSRPAPAVALRRPAADAPRGAAQRAMTALPAPETPVAPPRPSDSEPVPPAPDVEPEAVAWQHDGDGDGDGLLDEYELMVGLDPQSADSDGDGVSDEDEEAAPGASHFEVQARVGPPAGSRWQGDSDE